MEVKKQLSRIPIFGALFEIDPRATVEATIELTIGVIFSTLPIWFGAIIFAGNKIFEPNQTSSFWCLYTSFFVDSISNGELLMYAAATLGPTLYLGLKFLKNKKKPFPWIRPQFFITVVLSLLAAVFFFMARDHQYAGNLKFVIFSAIIYALSLLLLFPSMAFDQESTRDPKEAIKKSEDQYMKSYQAHRKSL